MLLIRTRGENYYKYTNKRTISIIFFITNSTKFVVERKAYITLSRIYISSPLI